MYPLSAPQDAPSLSRASSRLSKFRVKSDPTHSLRCQDVRCCMIWPCCIVAQPRSREAPLPLGACAHTRAPAHECSQTQAHRSFGRQRSEPQKRAHTEPLRLRACGFFRILIPWSCLKLRFPNVQISRWRSAKPGCRSWKRVIASRSDAPVDCVRARARGGYSVSRRSRKSVAPPSNANM